MRGWQRGTARSRSTTTRLRRAVSAQPGRVQRYHTWRALALLALAQELLLTFRVGGWRCFRPLIARPRRDVHSQTLRPAIERRHIEASSPGPRLDAALKASALRDNRNKQSVDSSLRTVWSRGCVGCKIKSVVYSPQCNVAIAGGKQRSTVRPSLARRLFRPSGIAYLYA